jgi:hypothetical protein
MNALVLGVVLVVSGIAAPHLLTRWFDAALYVGVGVAITGVVIVLRALVAIRAFDFVLGIGLVLAGVAVIVLLDLLFPSPLLIGGPPPPGWIPPPPPLTAASVVAVAALGALVAGVVILVASVLLRMRHLPKVE